MRKYNMLSAKYTRREDYLHGLGTDPQSWLWKGLSFRRFSDLLTVVGYLAQLNISVQAVMEKSGPSECIAITTP